MMAREGVDLAGVVSFHGLLNAGAPAQPGRVKARILVETGADDAMAPSIVPGYCQDFFSWSVAASIQTQMHSRKNFRKFSRKNI